MKKRKTSLKQKLIKLLITAIFAKIILMVGVHLVSPSISAKMINQYAQITHLEPSTIRNALDTITNPIKIYLVKIKDQIKN